MKYANNNRVNADLQGYKAPGLNRVYYRGSITIPSWAVELKALDSELLQNLSIDLCFGNIALFG